MVLDTMVFAYATLHVADHADDAERVLVVADEILVPDSMFSELTESARKWVAHGALPREDAVDALRECRSLVTHVVATPVVAERALELALDRRHPVYDALFVAVAELHGTRVVTFDRALLERFPDWTVSAQEFLRTAGGTGAS